MQPSHLGDLGHQAGLPDAGVAADQRQTGAARRGGPPQVLELAELVRPADQLGSGEAGAADGGLGIVGSGAGRVCGVIKRWKVWRVAGSGMTPSSRSRTEAQWW